MKDILKRLEEKKLKLDSYRPLPPALVKKLDEWFSIELTYNSNAIEGNTLTKRETALVVEKGLTIGGKTVREHIEAINHAIALNFIQDFATKSKKQITFNDILDIHRIILKGIDDDNAGRLRKIPVYIAGSDIELPSPLQLPDLVNDFIEWLHITQDHPLIIAAQTHYKIVTIHPFVDGNGRTARLIMNLLLLQTGYPPAIIELTKRKKYIDAIEMAQQTDDLSDFYIFIFESVEQSLDKYIQAAEQIIT